MKAFFTLVAFTASLSLFATDRIVEEFGQAPAYPSITAAVAAASDGDRIIVKNRASNIPWIEDIEVDKSLQFLSFANDDFFYVQGSYTIIGAAAREVTIIGMRNTSGGIAFASGGSVRGTSVRILDSYFVTGSILLNNNNFQADIIGCTLVNGRVAINFGNVVGCDIDGSLTGNKAISISGSAIATVDTCAIIGNKVKGGLGHDGIFINTTGQVAHVRNNFIQHGWTGINIYSGPNSGVQNLVWNNTIVAYTGSTACFGISLANTNSGSVWEVMNNVITRTWTGGTNSGIHKNSGNQGQINVYFNHVSSDVNPAISTGFTFTSDNTTDQVITLNADGTFDSPGGCIDGGNPAAALSDLDLSTGDAGAYGGSYTLTNFHPLHTGSARVYLTGHPINVRSGSTLRVKAVAFDR